MIASDAVAFAPAREQQGTIPRPLGREGLAASVAVKGLSRTCGGGGAHSAHIHPAPTILQHLE